MTKKCCIRNSSSNQQSQSSPVSGAGDLIGSNEDLLRTILIHSPHKSLARFKSVSKLWLSLISASDFSIQWHKKHITYPSALWIYLYFGYTFIALKEPEKSNPFSPNFGFNSLQLFHFCRHKVKILQSCNGLLLVHMKIKQKLQTIESRIGVYNSMTYQSKIIPKLPGHARLNRYVKLAFDPLKSPHLKLVLFAADTFLSKKILVYSSESDSWETIEVPNQIYSNYSYELRYAFDLMVNAGVYWNGGIYWPRTSTNTSLCFDIDENKIIQIPMPPVQGSKSKRIITYFGESGGHLQLIDHHGDFDNNSRFNVFELENDRSKWFVKYSVDLSALGQGSIKRFTFVSLVVENGDEDDYAVLVLYVPLDKVVISYNLKNGVLKNLCSLSLNRWEMDSLKTDNWSKVHHITC